jgi:hypothetical protein
MGSILTLSRQVLHLNNGSPMMPSNGTNNADMEATNTAAVQFTPYTDNQFQFTQTNSRLNLINQLMNVNGIGSSASSSTAAATHSQPPLSRYQQYQLNRRRTGAFGTRRRNKKLKTNSSSNLNDFTNISFASHFYMAGRKFKNLLQQTQTFLFGDQLDLAFVVAHKPACVFPYEAPVCVDAPSHCLQSLVNIRKDTLKLVKVKDALDSNQSSQQQSHHQTGILRAFEFLFKPCLFLIS